MRLTTLAMTLAALAALALTTKVAKDITTKDAVRVCNLVDDRIQVALKRPLDTTLEVIKPIATTALHRTRLFATAALADTTTHLSMGGENKLDWVNAESSASY